MFQIMHAARSIEIFVDCIVMYLAFRFNNELYFRYCRCCNSCCYTCCRNMTKYAVIKMKINETNGGISEKSKGSMYEKSNLTQIEESHATDLAISRD